MCSLDSVTVNALPQNKFWMQAINPMAQQYATRYAMFLQSHKIHCLTSQHLVNPCLVSREVRLFVQSTDIRRRLFLISVVYSIYTSHVYDASHIHSFPK